MIFVSTQFCKLLHLGLSNFKIKFYPISVGAPESPTQKGLFRIQERWLYPHYRTKDGKVYKGSKNKWTGIGPLLFIFADLKGKKMKHSMHGFVNNWKYRQAYVRVHTINFTQESSGCIRMDNKDILELDKCIKLGELVIIL